MSADLATLTNRPTTEPPSADHPAARPETLVTDLRAGHTDLTEKTYQALRALIVTRAVPPGSRMSAEGLSQRFGVSRTTVKDAINQLATEGLVEVRPQVGTFVRGLTERDVRDIWDARVMLEVYAGRQGVRRASDAQRQELHALVDAMAPLIEGHEYREEHYERFVALDRRFHELIVESADNAYLLGLFRQINVHVHIVNYQSRRGIRRADKGLQEHRMIVAAYERRDPGLLAEVVTQHIERSRDVVLKSLALHGNVL